MQDDRSLTIRDKRGVATWFKVLSAIVLVSAVLFAGFAFAAYSFLKNFKNDSLNPQKIAQAASTIATFQKPMPKRFRFVLGVSSPLQSSLGIRDGVSGMGMSIVRMPVIGRPISDEAQLKLNSALLVEQSKMGYMPIAGEKLIYVIGRSRTSEAEMLTGLVLSKNRKTRLTFTAFAKPGRKIDVSAVKAFLATIRSF